MSLLAQGCVAAQLVCAAIAQSNVANPVVKPLAEFARRRDWRIRARIIPTLKR
jgi:hypothetical protein